MFVANYDNLIYLQLAILISHEIYFNSVYLYLTSYYNTAHIHMLLWKLE